MKITKTSAAAIRRGLRDEYGFSGFGMEDAPLFKPGSIPEGRYPMTGNLGNDIWITPTGFTAFIYAGFGDRTEIITARLDHVDPIVSLISPLIKCAYTEQNGFCVFNYPLAHFSVSNLSPHYCARIAQKDFEIHDKLGRYEKLKAREGKGPPPPTPDWKEGHRFYKGPVFKVRPGDYKVEEIVVDL